MCRPARPPPRRKAPWGLIFGGTANVAIASRPPRLKGSPRRGSAGDSGGVVRVGGGGALGGEAGVAALQLTHVLRALRVVGRHQLQAAP